MSIIRSPDTRSESAVNTDDLLSNGTHHVELDLESEDNGPENPFGFIVGIPENGNDVSPRARNALIELLVDHFFGYKHAVVVGKTAQGERAFLEGVRSFAPASPKRFG